MTTMQALKDRDMDREVLYYEAMDLLRYDSAIHGQSNRGERILEGYAMADAVFPGLRDFLEDTLPGCKRVIWGISAAEAWPHEGPGEITTIGLTAIGKSPYGCRYRMRISVPWEAVLLGAKAYRTVALSQLHRLLREAKLC